MANHSISPHLPATQFPIQVLTYEQFEVLLNSFKKDFFDVLIAEGQLSSSKTVQVLETTTTKVGKLILKRTDRMVTDPEDLPIPTFDPNEYTLQDLWSVLSKRGKYRKLRALLMGRSIKTGLSSIIMDKLNKARRLRPVINREDVAKWLVIRKVVFEALTNEQMADWCLLSGIMAVSQGGKLLKFSSNSIEKEPRNRGRFVPVVSSQLPVHTAPTPVVNEPEPPMRPANIPRVRGPAAGTTSLAGFKEQVGMLEKAAILKERATIMASEKRMKTPNLESPHSKLEVEPTSSVEDEFEYVQYRPWDGDLLDGSYNDGNTSSNSDSRSSASNDSSSRVNWVAFCT